MEVQRYGKAKFRRLSIIHIRLRIYKVFFVKVWVCCGSQSSDTASLSSRSLYVVERPATCWIAKQIAAIDVTEDKKKSLPGYK